MKSISKPWFVLTVFACLLCSSTAYAQGRRVALVIGNSKYARGTLRPLVGNEAAVMAEFLRKSGFKVVEARDLDEQELRRALGDFSRSIVSDKDDVVLYYSGYV